MDLFASGGPLVFNATGTFGYMAASSSVAIILFDVDPDTGLYTTPQVVEPLPAPHALAIAPSGKFLYATNIGDSTLSTFAIGEDGRLAASGTPIALAAVPSGITIASLFS